MWKKFFITYIHIHKSSHVPHHTVCFRQKRLAVYLSSDWPTFICFIYVGNLLTLQVKGLEITDTPLQNIFYKSYKLSSSQTDSLYVNIQMNDV